MPDGTGGAGAGAAGGQGSRTLSRICCCAAGISPLRLTHNGWSHLGHLNLTKGRPKLLVGRSALLLATATAATATALTLAEDAVHDQKC